MIDKAIIDAKLMQFRNWVQPEYLRWREVFMKRVGKHKPMVIMLLSVLIIFGLIIGYKWIGRKIMLQHLERMKAPIVTISALPAEYQTWQTLLYAPGIVSAIRGVDVTSEVSGLVREMFFDGGEEVNVGDPLIQLTNAAELAQLEKLRADLDLAVIVYERNKSQFEVQAVSKAVLDASEADLRAKTALVAEQEATVAKRNIRAPFSGKLGINYLSLGQYVTPGLKIASLQQLDPVYVYFHLPQQSTLEIRKQQRVQVKADGIPNKVFIGEISTIDPKLNEATRNLEIESIIQSPEKQLLPGMFVNVEIEVGEAKKLLTLPQSAISFNPYGDIVYVLEDAKSKDNAGREIYIAQQTFVTTGSRRGDQISILSGIEPGRLIVVQGQNKLRNGSRVVINNTGLNQTSAVPSAQTVGD